MTNFKSPIADQVAEMHAGQPDSPFRREQTQLQAGPIPVTSVPMSFPDDELIDVEGHATTFRQTVAGSPSVVVFYRGAWCPYCNLTLATYREQLAQNLSKRGVALVAISPQRPDGSLTVKERHELQFAVLSDAGNKIAGALGILTGPSPEALGAQLENGLDLTAVNLDGTTSLPMPTVAIVDADGVLVWIDVHPDYSTRTEPQQILDALSGLGY